MLGRGFESFWLGWRLLKVQNAYRFQLQEAHNGYLEIYLNLGWIGIALLATLVVTGYQNVLAGFRYNFQTASLRLGILVMALIYNLTEAAFRTQNPVWIVFLLVTIAVPRVSTQQGLTAIRKANGAASDSHLDQLVVAGSRQEVV